MKINLHRIVKSLSLLLLFVGVTQGEMKSIRTSLDSKACKEIMDPEDPNNTPYQKCPGVAGYALIARNAEGRQSIDVVAPNQEIFPLSYWDVITTHFSHLDNSAEWRVKKDKTPVALIVRVESHEDEDEPERVTHSYFAVAKITPKEICVTDKILLGSLSPEKISAAADSAPSKKCLELPQ